MGEMAVMDRTGDTKIMWDKNKQDEVDVAAETFKKLKKKGYLAYKVEGAQGDKGELIKDFDPNAERLIMAPPMVGG